MAGTIDKAKGRLKQSVGELTGNKKLQRQGVIDRLSGDLKSGVQKVKKMLKGKRVR